MTVATMNTEFSLTDTFNSFAERAVTDFPQMKDRFVFYSAPTDTVLGSFGDDGEALKTYLREEVKKQVATGFVPQASALPNSDDYFLMINYMSGPENAQHEMEVRRVLEHELGHLVGPGGHNHFTHHFVECVADTFSFIRQQQKYPSAPDAMELSLFKNTLPFLLKGNADIFTAPAIQGFREFSEAHDVQELNLTPAQTANLAYRLSLRNALAPQELEKLAEIFEPVRRGYEGEGGWRDALQECAKLMLEDHGEDTRKVFMTAKAVLTPFLEHDMNVLGTIFPPEAAENFQLTGDFWYDFRRKLKDREEQMKETPEQARERKIDYLEALGHFDADQDPNKLIDTAKYESPENDAHLEKAREEYTARADKKPVVPANRISR